MRSSCWKGSKHVVQYIELDNMGTDEETGDGNRLLGRVRRWDIRGLLRDCAWMFLFVVGCITMQIIGLY